MRRPFLTIAFLLILVAACNSPYATRFQQEHREYPLGDPKVAAIRFPDTISRLEYGFYKQVCPGKNMKSVENAVKSIVGSELVKSIAESSEGNSLSIIPAASEQISQIVSDSIDAQAVSYEGSREAMAAAIGTALASDYSCNSIESASRIYYSYGRPEYVSDLCSGHSSLKTVLKTLEKSKPPAELQAVPLLAGLEPSYEEIMARDARLGGAVKRGDIDRLEAMELMVRNLKSLPLCHEIASDYTERLSNLAKSDDIYFFELYDSVRSFRSKCPINASGYILYEMDGGIFIFRGPSGEKVPLAFMVNDTEPHPEKPVQFDVTGPLPVKGEDVWFEEMEESEGLPPTRLGIGYVALIPLLGVIAWSWFRGKKKRSA